MVSRRTRSLTVACVLVLTALVAAWLVGRGARLGDAASVDRRAKGDLSEEEARLRGRGPEDLAAPSATLPEGHADGPCTVHVAAYDEAYDPLPGATVVVVFADGSERSVTTGEKGTARLEDVPAGSFRATATKPGYTTSDVETACAATWRETWLRLGVERAGALRGTVVGDRDGRAVEGAAVTVHEAEPVGMNPGAPSLGRAFGHALTDARGSFRIDGVPLVEPFAVQLVRVEAAGYRTVWRVAPPPGEDEDHVVRLVPGGAVSGRVVDAAGRPVAGATVHAALDAGGWLDPTFAPRVVALPDHLDSRSLFGRGGTHPECAAADAWATLETRTGADGRFRLEGMGLGERYVLGATAPGHAASKPHPGVRVRGEPPVPEVVLRLEPACALTVRCTDADGRPYPDLEVSISYGRGYGALAPPVRTDARGVARIGDVGAGRYHVRIRDERLEHTLEEDPELTPGENELIVRSPKRPSDPRPVPRVVPPEERPTPARELPPTLVGRVAIAPGAEPPDDVQLTGRGRGGSAWGGRAWEPDADGTLPIRWTWDLPRFTFSVEAAGFVPVVREVVRMREETVDLGTLVLRPGEALDGRVLTPDGDPLPDVRVALTFHVDAPDAAGDGRDFTRWAPTDEDGRFHVGGLPPGSVTVRLEDARFLATSEEILVPREEPVRLVPPTGGWLGVTAVDAEEYPVPRCSVRLRRVRGEELELEAYGVTDVAGRFRVRVPAGAYQLAVVGTAGRQEGEVEMLDVEVTEGETRDVRVRLERL